MHGNAAAPPLGIVVTGCRERHLLGTGRPWNRRKPDDAVERRRGMKRLLPAILPSTLALVGFLLVVVSEKAHRVYQPCPLAPIRVVARCGGTAPGPLEPRYLLF